MRGLQRLGEYLWEFFVVTAIAAVSAVTEERVRQAAACVRPDTIYFLKGKEA